MIVNLSRIVLLCSLCEPTFTQPHDGATKVTAEGIAAHMRRLSSDEFEGRGPGSQGEEKTVQYLSDQFRQAGLSPGNPDGTYYQNVPLTVLSLRGSLWFTVRSKEIALGPEDVLMASFSEAASTRIVDAPVVFAGYGISDSAAGWDDY